MISKYLKSVWITKNEIFYLLQYLQQNMKKYFLINLTIIISCYYNVFVIKNNKRWNDSDISLTFIVVIWAKEDQHRFLMFCLLNNAQIIIISERNIKLIWRLINNLRNFFFFFCFCSFSFLLSCRIQLEYLYASNCKNSRRWF